MHKPEYIKLITKAASELGIHVACIADNWAIQLKKDGIKKFIVGYTFPLNDSACYKIIRNKNLCSEILTLNNIANVPHQLVFSPSILVKRKSNEGNFKIIEKFISTNGFPLLIKKNNSSKGEGTFLINNEPELEDTLSKVYTTDSTLCLSPYREKVREYRNIVLDGRCLLSYEKHIPFIIGDGKSTIIDLLADFLKENRDTSIRPERLFDNSLMANFNTIPKQNEKVFLQWKHNRFLGTRYEIIDDTKIKHLAIKSVSTVNARFVSVDIIDSEKFGLEVLEINASVGIHYPIHYPDRSIYFENEIDIYRLALKETFTLK